MAIERPQHQEGSCLECCGFSAKRAVRNWAFVPSPRASRAGTDNGRADYFGRLEAQASPGAPLKGTVHTTLRATSMAQALGPVLSWWHKLFGPVPPPSAPFTRRGWASAPAAGLLANRPGRQKSESTYVRVTPSARPGTIYEKSPGPRRPASCKGLEAQAFSLWPFSKPSGTQRRGYPDSSG
jgi:hypothetical protein